MEKEDLLTIETGTIEDFLNEMHESGYPAVHHSSVYRNAYSPSYRVIASSLIRELEIIQPIIKNKKGPIIINYKDLERWEVAYNSSNIFTIYSLL